MKEHLENITEGAIILGVILCCIVAFVLIVASLVLAYRWGGWWTLGVVPSVVVICWFIGMINRGAGW